MSLSLNRQRHFVRLSETNFAIQLSPRSFSGLQQALQHNLTKLREFCAVCVYDGNPPSHCANYQNVAEFYHVMSIVGHIKLRSPSSLSIHLSKCFQRRNVFINEYETHWRWNNSNARLICSGIFCMQSLIRSPNMRDVRNWCISKR